MKTPVCLKIILVFTCCFLATTEILQAQKTEARLVFKDGTILNGLGKLKGAVCVKFRKDKNTKAKKYHFKDLESVQIYNGDSRTTYVYLLVKKKKKYKVLEEVVVGGISLYKVVSHGAHAPMGVGFGGAGGMGMGMGMSTGFTIKSYYLRRKEEKEVTHITSTDLFSKNFKKAATAYFNDCPDLVEKIETKEYRKRDIRAIIEFYNSKCQ
jgi:hypothetical protein